MVMSFFIEHPISMGIMTEPFCLDGLGQASGGFPDPDQCTHPDGLLAFGGDLSPERLLHAYRQGIFPWYSPGSPILWWSPDPREIFIPARFQCSKRMRRTMKKPWSITFDAAFARVMNECGKPSPQRPETWITPAMIKAYNELHALGYGHSVEVWWADELVGGLYGVALGGCFFAESKFHLKTDASKVALIALITALDQWQFTLLDAQMPTPHLKALGSVSVSRRDFRLLLNEGCNGRPKHPTHQPGLWQKYSADPFLNDSIN